MEEFFRFSVRNGRDGLLLAILVAVIALFGGMAFSGTALAEEDPVTPGDPLPDEPTAGIICSGEVVKGVADPLYAYEYGFKCNKDLVGFSIVSNREIDGAVSEPFGFTPEGETAPGDDFFCKSTLPGWGFACYGRFSGGANATLNAGNIMRAGFSLADPICDANEQAGFWLIPVYQYEEENNLVNPPTVRRFTAAGEPVRLNASDVRCKVLNPKAKARKACARVARAEGQAKKKARAQCKKARQAVQASR